MSEPLDLKKLDLRLIVGVDEKAQACVDALMDNHLLDRGGRPLFGAHTYVIQGADVICFDHEGFGQQVKTMATDGRHILINGEFLDRLLSDDGLTRQDLIDGKRSASVLAGLVHEAEHILHEDHTPERLPESQDPRERNIVFDMGINTRMQADRPEIGFSRELSQQLVGFRENDVKRFAYKSDSTILRELREDRQRAIDEAAKDKKQGGSEGGDQPQDSKGAADTGQPGQSGQEPGTNKDGGDKTQQDGQGQEQDPASQDQEQPGSGQVGGPKQGQEPGENKQNPGEQVNKEGGQKQEGGNEPGQDEGSKREGQKQENGQAGQGQGGKQGQDGEESAQKDDAGQGGQGQESGEQAKQDGQPQSGGPGSQGQKQDQAGGSAERGQQEQEAQGQGAEARQPGGGQEQEGGEQAKQDGQTHPGGGAQSQGEKQDQGGQVAGRDQQGSGDGQDPDQQEGGNKQQAAQGAQATSGADEQAGAKPDPGKQETSPDAHAGAADDGDQTLDDGPMTPRQLREALQRAGIKPEDLASSDLPETEEQEKQYNEQTREQLADQVAAYSKDTKRSLNDPQNPMRISDELKDKVRQRTKDKAGEPGQESGAVQEDVESRTAGKQSQGARQGRPMAGTGRGNSSVLASVERSGPPIIRWRLGDLGQGEDQGNRRELLHGQGRRSSATMRPNPGRKYRNYSEDVLYDDTSVIVPGSGANVAGMDGMMISSSAYLHGNSGVAHAPGARQSGRARRGIGGQTPAVVVLIDTSISMKGTEKACAQAVYDLMRAARREGRQVDILAFCADTNIGHAAEYSEKDMRKFVKSGMPMFGGGGTDFVSPLQSMTIAPQLKDREILGVVYLTDMGARIPDVDQIPSSIKKVSFIDMTKSGRRQEYNDKVSIIPVVNERSEPAVVRLTAEGRGMTFGAKMNRRRADGSRGSAPKVR